MVLLLLVMLRLDVHLQKVCRQSVVPVEIALVVLLLLVQMRSVRVRLVMVKVHLVMMQVFVRLLAVLLGQVVLLVLVAVLVWVDLLDLAEMLEPAVLPVRMQVRCSVVVRPQTMHRLMQVA